MGHRPPSCRVLQDRLLLNRACPISSVHARERLPFDASAAAILVGLGHAHAATAVRWNRQQGWTTLRRAIDYYVQAGQISRAIAVVASGAIPTWDLGVGISLRSPT